LDRTGKPGGIEVQDAAVMYGRVQALHGVSVSVPPGEITGVLGANGAGKSTLLRAISGFAPLRSGRILLDGQDITRMLPHQRSRAGIVHVFEGGKAFSELTVEENLEVGGTRLPGPELPRRLDQMYALFPRLRERRTQEAQTLSGGERQMLLLARALMAAPRILLLDEPSLGLAPRIVAATFERIKEISAMGVTILLVEQKAGFTLDTCHRGYVLRNGRVAFAGTAEAVRAAPELRSAYLSHVA
jgi:branched-chain amino acid transport system ATP-binding protein